MLTTDRLIIRPFRESDYNDLYEYLSLEETYRYEPGEPITKNEAKKIAAERAGGADFRAVTLKENKQKLIGHVSFIQIEPKQFRTWEIGFIFHPDFQNKGYATEASRAIIENAFRELNAHRVVGYCAVDNIASWRVLEKCGMRREGLQHKNAFFHKDKNGRPIWFDSFQYALLAEDTR
jgi:ribosomal-protein-alanine N-acetyltransferase